nr:uncharacterized protein LOC102151000 [Equus caballus]
MRLGMQVEPQQAGLPMPGSGARTLSWGRWEDSARANKLILQFTGGETEAGAQTCVVAPMLSSSGCQLPLRHPRRQLPPTCRRAQDNEGTEQWISTSEPQFLHLHGGAVKRSQLVGLGTAWSPPSFKDTGFLREWRRAVGVKGVRLERGWFRQREPRTDGKMGQHRPRVAAPSSAPGASREGDRPLSTRRRRDQGVCNPPAKVPATP